ncbi:MAG TPA: ABC transporter permease [Anaerolineae bacterium]|nr:ABC transporter permease [Anaerolineae bacterium]HQI84019.1 ABC transporter permease [Anaerolineae bacterium]
MKFWESVRLAVKALTANKMRAALTMLGIIIGVGAVITLMSAGEGVQAYITKQFQSIGSNLFFVIPGSFDQELKRPAYLTLKDAEALRNVAEAPHVLRVAPLLQGSARITTPGKDKIVDVNGVTDDYAAVRDWATRSGTFITPADNQGQARIAVLGKKTADYFFPESPDPSGEVIRVNGVPFRVVGVMEERGGSNFRSEDEVIFIPLNTALSRIFPRRTNTGEPRLTFIYVQAVAEDRMNAAIEEVAQILRQRHRIAPGDPDDFTAISQSEIIGTFQQITGVLTVFLGAIAGISLLVGGIGIMNIMLVSVTERTREIGLRKAVGARKRDILAQFLTEAVMLSLIGGIIGILLGASGAAVVSYLLRNEGFRAIITVNAVLLATLFSAGVGLFFGIYPAQRASALNPIDALRYE